jgi:hypothetical protein
MRARISFGEEYEDPRDQDSQRRQGDDDLHNLLKSLQTGANIIKLVYFVIAHLHVRFLGQILH